MVQGCSLEFIADGSQGLPKVVSKLQSNMHIIFFWVVVNQKATAYVWDYLNRTVALTYAINYTLKLIIKKKKMRLVDGGWFGQLRKVY